MGYVYLLSNGDNYFKIGVTKGSIEKRIKALQTGNPEEITLIDSYKTNNYRKVESWFHRQHKLKRLEGEWFALEQTDIDNFVNEAKKIDDNINALKNNPFF